MTTSKRRVVLFSSAYQGEEILRQFLSNERLMESTEVVGVVRDDPSNPVCKANIRTWKYLDQLKLPLRVEHLAKRNGIKVYSDDLANNDFYQTFVSSWRPDLSISCVFGQKITSRYRSEAKLGTLNLHPCTSSPFDVWPSAYAGVLPIRRMLDDGIEGHYWAAHFMTDELDAGPPVAYSPWTRINKADSLARNHEVQSPLIARFVSDVTAVILGLCEPSDVKPPTGNANFGPLRNWYSIQCRNPLVSDLQSRRGELLSSPPAAPHSTGSRKEPSCESSVPRQV